MFKRIFLGILILAITNCGKPSGSNKNEKEHLSLQGLSEDKKSLMSKDDAFFNFRKKLAKTDKLLWKELKKGDKLKCYTYVMTGFKSYVIFKVDKEDVNIGFLNLLRREGKLEFKIKKQFVYIEILPLTDFVLNYGNIDNLFKNANYEVYIEKIIGRAIYSKDVDFIKRTYANNSVLYHLIKGIPEEEFKKRQRKNEKPGKL